MRNTKREGQMEGRCWVKLWWWWGGGVVGCSHAITEAGLWGLAVTWCCCVTVAIGLLRRHGHVGPCCEHELGCACNRNISSEEHGRSHIVQKIFPVTLTATQLLSASGLFFFFFYRKQWVETQ